MMIFSFFLNFEFHFLLRSVVFVCKDSGSSAFFDLSSHGLENSLILLRSCSWC